MIVLNTLSSRLYVCNFKILLIFIQSFNASPQLPEEGDDVEITSPIMLGSATPRLRWVCSGHQVNVSFRHYSLAILLAPLYIGRRLFQKKRKRSNTKSHPVIIQNLLVYTVRILCSTCNQSPSGMSQSRTAVDWCLIPRLRRDRCSPLLRFGWYFYGYFVDSYTWTHCQRRNEMTNKPRRKYCFNKIVFFY